MNKLRSTLRSKELSFFLIRLSIIVLLVGFLFRSVEILVVAFAWSMFAASSQIQLPKVGPWRHFPK